MEFQLGNECIARAAIDAGVHSAYAYPGTPSSEILSAFAQLAPDRFSQWSMNEKTALECAVAGAVSGERTLCAMKQVGLNAAADPFFSAAYIGVTGALVLVSADDPGPHSSQTEQDSRMYAHAARVPVFDPASPADAYALTLRAFELSARHRVPVMVRPVMRVCHSRMGVDLPGAPAPMAAKGSFARDVARWAATPRHRAALHAELLAKIEAIAGENVIEVPARRRVAVVASGYAWSLARDLEDEISGECDLVKVDLPYPLSVEAIEKLEAAYERIVVLEETFPVMENQFLDKRKISGKWNGCVPSRGELSLDVVRDALGAALGRSARTRPAAPAREVPPPARPTLCAGCGHRAAFFAIRRAFPKGIFAGDIGCYTLGVNLGAVDTVLDMGASVSFAESLSRANPDRPVVATIGDSTFFHSGIPPLLNAVSSGASFVLAILDNATTAMTGFQPVPHAPGSRIRIEDVVRGVGVSFVEVIDPYELDGSVKLVKRAMEHARREKAPAVIVFRHACVTKDRLRGEIRPRIEESCTNCGICYSKFECPALHEDPAAERAAVDERLCTGCGVCLSVCPLDAIVRESSDA